MQVINRKSLINYAPQSFGANRKEVSIIKIEDLPQLEIYELTVPQTATNAPLTIQWKFKALGVKGTWTSNNILDKRFRTDWEMVKLKSTISVDAPILNLFGYSDENMLTIACADLINLIHIQGSLREEDNHFYFKFQFFIEEGYHEDYKTKIYINKTHKNFSKVIQTTADWLVIENGIKVSSTPPLSKTPLYSTWYAFHQDLDRDEVIKECKASKKLGYELVIIDDGWQTLDDGRGYDYTGDWKPDRFPDMKGFVEEIHNLGMGIMLWYSVPFCGKKSEAYKKFKGKFLTENHYWAPVFDPRFPEIRKYLVELYCNALTLWNIDGFKLDFIDDFKLYNDTETKQLNGRDTLSVAQGCKKLVQEIAIALAAIKPDILIEFRQQYINPALRQLGNMFRAFDCPNDSLMNRVRTTDVKLLCGKSIVHSDMLTWHKEEPVEVAASQFTSILFSVPQLSVKVRERTEDEIAMINFYTNYWKEHKHILLDGQFTAYRPLSNYSHLSASADNFTIHGLYDDIVVPINLNQEKIHIINGKMSRQVVIDFKGAEATWKRKVTNCKGEIKLEDNITLTGSIYSMDCPANGIIFLSKK